MIEMKNCRARLLGDDINTDYIISSRRKRESLDPAVLGSYLLEDLDPGFATTLRQGDILVAGSNFGCGSAMEVAVTVVLGAGIRAIVAKSFSRTYYRNAVNNGLSPIIADTSSFEEGDALSILAAQEVLVTNHRTGKVVRGEFMPEIMTRILLAGGIVPYFSMHKDFVV